MAGRPAGPVTAWRIVRAGDDNLHALAIDAEIRGEPLRGGSLVAMMRASRASRRFSMPCSAVRSAR